MHPLSVFTSANVILLFHIVPSKDWFADTLRRAAAYFDFVSAQEIVSYYRGDVRFNNRCHVSFDDGERTIYENAFPVLKDMRVPATLFVSPEVIVRGRNYWFQELREIRKRTGDVTIKRAICERLGCAYDKLARYHVLSALKCMRLADILGVVESVKESHAIEITDKHNMTPEQLRQLSRSGVVTVGAHTMNHPILSNESDEVAEREIRESVEKLSELLGAGVECFSYPNGTRLDYGPREIKVLQDCGIKLAFTEDMGFFGRKDDPYCLPRAGFATSAGSTNPGLSVRLLLLPVWDRMRRLARLGKTEISEREEITRLSSFVT